MKPTNVTRLGAIVYLNNQKFNTLGSNSAK